MKKLLLLMFGVLMALPTFARDFTYYYEGQTLTYTVISETSKTVKTKDGRGVITSREYCFRDSHNPGDCKRRQY